MKCGYLYKISLIFNDFPQIVNDFYLKNIKFQIHRVESLVFSTLAETLIFS